MPQDNTLTDFAELWAEYTQARVTAPTRQTYTYDWATPEAMAARALLDALTGDAELRVLMATYYRRGQAGPDVPSRYIDMLMAANDVIERLTMMGLLHGPEEATHGE